MNSLSSCSNFEKNCLLSWCNQIFQSSYPTYFLLSRSFFSLLSTLCIVKMSYALPSEFPPNRNASLPTCGEFLIKKKNLLPTTIDPPAVIFSSKAKTWLTELRSFNSTRKRRSWTRSDARVWESQWLSDSRRGNKENFSETRRSNSARNARKEKNDEEKELSKLPEGKGGW